VYSALLLSNADRGTRNAFLLLSKQKFPKSYIYANKRGAEYPSASRFSRPFYQTPKGRIDIVDCGAIVAIVDAW
jgi:hypothetical protein